MQTFIWLQDEKSYKALWDLLKQQGAVEEGVSPRNIMSDYELPLMQSAQASLPWAQVYYIIF
jgi:hypothetical protein